MRGLNLMYYLSIFFCLTSVNTVLYLHKCLSHLSKVLYTVSDIVVKVALCL